MNRIFTLAASLLMMLSVTVNAQDQTYVMKMKTAKPVGGWIGFYIEVPEGEEYTVTGATLDPSDGSCQLTSQEVEVRGKITRFSCSNNELESLDVSGNPNLTELYCDDNVLTSLTLGTQPNLTDIYIGNNHLNSVDFSGATAITSLSTYGNSLTSLSSDIAPLTNLKELYCRECGLDGTLDLTRNPKLEILAAYNNNLTGIKLPANSHIGKLEIERNRISGQNMTALVNALPEYQVLPDYDDFWGMEPQGIYIFEYDSDVEENALSVDDFNALKAKGWPVYSVDNVDSFDDTQEVTLETLGIDAVKSGSAVGGSDAAAVYDLSGRRLSASSLGTLKAGARGGVYVVKAGGTTKKVVLK